MLCVIVFQSVNLICCHRNRSPSEMHPISSEIIIPNSFISWNNSNRYPECQRLGSKLHFLLLFNYFKYKKRGEKNSETHENTKIFKVRIFLLDYSWNSIKIEQHMPFRKDKRCFKWLNRTKWFISTAVFFLAKEHVNLYIGRIPTSRVDF